MLTTTETRPTRRRAMQPAVAAEIVATIEDLARKYCDAMDAAGREVRHIHLTARQRQALDVHYPHDTQAHLRATFHGIPYRTAP